MDNKCVCCGEIIPEGRMACPNCEARAAALEARRRRTNHAHGALYEYDGKVRTLTEWSSLTGLSRSAITARLARGWTIEEALITPRGSDKPTKYEDSKKCRGCKYSKNVWSAKDDLAYYCDYLLMTGHKRPIKAEDCAGWDKAGKWRGPGPEPVPEKR